MRSSKAVGTPLTKSLRMTVKIPKSAWDSAEKEKARLLTAARSKESRTAVMSSFSAAASSGVMIRGSSDFLPCYVVLAMVFIRPSR